MRKPECGRQSSVAEDENARVQCAIAAVTEKPLGEVLAALVEEEPDLRQHISSTCPMRPCLRSEGIPHTAGGRGAELPLLAYMRQVLEQDRARLYEGEKLADVKSPREAHMWIIYIGAETEEILWYVFCFPGPQT